MAPSWPVVAEGATGEDVRTIQFSLNAHGQKLAVGGGFGPLPRQGSRPFRPRWAFPPMGLWPAKRDRRS